MSNKANGLGHLLTTIGSVALALVLSFSIPALWIAWSQVSFLAVLGIGAAAAVLYCLVALFEESIFGMPGSAGR